MRILTFLFFAVCYLQVMANDGAYYSHGGVFYPLQESSISMVKEVLQFNCENQLAHVSVRFDFYNPESKTKKLLVGFQAPNSNGDIDEELINSENVLNFKVFQGQQTLSTEMKVAECEDCPLQNPGEIVFNQGSSGVFVYLFEVNFPPGITQLDQTYDFKASSSVSIEKFYDYILTTGAKWEGKHIQDLTIQINPGKNNWFYVTDIFGIDAAWNIIGKGNVSQEIRYVNDIPSRMVRLMDGYLQIHVVDFLPEKNLEFGIVSSHCFMADDPESVSYSNLIQAVNTLNLGNNQAYSKEELAILRNTIYAQYGYVFKTKKWQEYFEDFAWYYPLPELQLSDIQLTPEEHDFVFEIQQNEKK